jgi:hypothetical protein
MGFVSGVLERFLAGIAVFIFGKLYDFFKKTFFLHNPCVTDMSVIIGGKKASRP